MTAYDYDAGDYTASGRPRDRRWAIAVYILYLVGACSGVFFFIGLAAAFIRKPRAGALWRSHYRFQLRGAGFYILFLIAIGLMMGLFISARLGPLAMLTGLGFAVVFVWWIARNIRGLLRALEDEPIRDPRSLAW